LRVVPGEVPDLFGSAKECFLRGWHHLGQHQWGKKPETDGYEDDGLAALLLHVE
jgi:hypothetical protein